ncbi:MAG: thiamine-phosphate kinase [Methanobacteriaceae archaeon]|nr:thiamine-phosphate kinase [Methanobacteriaceae archaeon]
MPCKILSDLGEKRLIQRILKKTKNIQYSSSFLNNKSLESLSDDAALLDFGENYLVATADMLFESKHFPKEMNPYQMGKKIVTVNVSDLAAMGAKPIGILISLGLPRDMKLKDFDSLIDGILNACFKYNTPLIGGDTNESDEITLSGTCLGVVEKDKVMMKNSADFEDVVAVTGSIGLAAAGFQYLFKNSDKIKISEEFKKKIIKHALEPEVPLKKAMELSKSGQVNSATDITDGLISEIGELVSSSSKNIGITIYQDKLPIPSEVFDIAQIVKEDPLNMALCYGEDFELLITVKKGKFEGLSENISLKEIGKVNSSGKIEIVYKDGKTNVITPRGYEHMGGAHEKRSNAI